MVIDRMKAINKKRKKIEKWYKIAIIIIKLSNKIYKPI